MIYLFHEWLKNENQGVHYQAVIFVCFKNIMI
jgi:hypothetical protein